MSARPEASRVRASERPYMGHEGPKLCRGAVAGVDAGVVGSDVSVKGNLSPRCTSAVLRFATQ